MLGALAGGVAVAADALGAHLLRATLTEVAMENYETGVRYLLLHAVLLLSLGLSVAQSRLRWPWQLCMLGILTGTCLFSGGLMLWTTQGWGWARACAPWGGSVLILSWLGLALCALLFWNHRANEAVGIPDQRGAGLPHGSLES